MSEGQYQPIYQNQTGQVHEGQGYSPVTAVPVQQPVYGAPQSYQPPNAYTQPPSGAIAVPVAYATAVPGQSGLAAGMQGHLPRTGGWSDGLCDCFNNCESLLLAWCIAPYLWARTVSRAKLASFMQALLMLGIPWLLIFIFYSVGVNGSQSCTYECYSWGCVTTCHSTVQGWAIGLAGACNFIWIFLGCTYRTKIRNQYGINGSQGEDCLLYMCCTCCAMTQEARHVDRDTGYIAL